jgi:ABC-type multidrug transport system ATPase subunit
VKLVLMDNAPKGMQAGKDYVSVVSGDNFSAGGTAASQLAQYLGPNATVGIIGYGVEFFATDQRENAFKKWMTDNRPDVDLQTTYFSHPAEAGAVAADFLGAHPELDGLFVVWDDPALAAARVAREQGRMIPITSVDLGREVALALAEDGLIKGVAAQVPYDQGVAEALVAINAMLGKQPPPWIALPTVPVTPANLLKAYQDVWHAPPPAELIEASRSTSASGSAAAQPAAKPPRPAQHGEERPLLELRDVRNDRLRGVDLLLNPGEIVGLAGILGSGRTEILETIFGLRRVVSGELLLNNERVVMASPNDAIRRGLAFVPEDRHRQGLVLEHSIESNMALPRLPQLARFGMFRRGESNARATSAMKELSIKAPNSSALLRNLSGGNQQKVVFGKWRDPNPTLLLLDEPSVGVDVGARSEIYDVIRRIAGAGSAVLVVSSELAELLLLCDRMGIVARGRIVKGVTRAEIENEENLHRLVQEASET